MTRAAAMVFTAVWLTSGGAAAQPAGDPPDGSEPIDVTVEDGGEGSEPIDVTVGEDDAADGTEPIDETAPEEPTDDAADGTEPIDETAPEPPSAAQETPAKPDAEAVEVEGEVDLTGEAPPDDADEEEEETSWLDAPATRRQGFTFGLLLGALMGAAEGFPNDALKVDRDAFRTNTGFGGGGYLHAFIGVTFTDWIGFGLGGGAGRLISSDYETRAFAIDFRIDAWPLYGLGGVWEDLGINLTAGLGGSNTALKEGDDALLIEGGLTSHVATGVFWEPIQLWRINMGPFASFDAQFSQTALQTSAWVGWRTVLYAGPSRDDDDAAEE